MGASLDLGPAAERLLDLCRAQGLRLATAESCTGGLVAAALTEIAGASDVYERGYVTYSNQAKTEALGVPADLIEAKGAVSAEVARAMASGAVARSGADLAVAVTGVAGPAGGTPQKPIGLVYIAVADKAGVTTVDAHNFGDAGRHAVRLASASAALEHLWRRLNRA